MAKLFEISVPDGLQALKLDSQYRASVHYTVRHLGRVPVDARAVLIQVPASPADPNHPVQKGWVKIDGKPERHFDVNGEDTFTVNVAIPPKIAQPGTYGYRLDVVSIARPDEGDSSPILKFDVKAAEKAKPKWGILAAVIALVVVIGGVAAYFIFHKSGVPNVVGMNISDATTALTKANINIAQPIATKVGKDTDVDIVLDQSVPAGTAIASGTTTTIGLTVGAQMVPVPNLIGLSISDATKALGANLVLGNSTLMPNPGFPPGHIWQQKPGAGEKTQSNGAVDVTVTPMTVTVPSLSGLTLDAALKTISQAQLTYAGHTGNLTDQPTTGQIPPAGQTAQAGAEVTLIFPSSFVCSPPARCFVSKQSTLLMNRNLYVQK
jgi:beta-lactam-binding protein with PASTA domain